MLTKGFKDNLSAWFDLSARHEGDLRITTWVPVRDDVRGADGAVRLGAMAFAGTRAPLIRILFVSIAHRSRSLTFRMSASGTLCTVTVKEPDLEVCPRLSLAFGVLGKRWNALILDVLGQRAARFSEIRRAVPGLSDRLLGERLVELAAAGLVARTQEGDDPVRYSLTERGRLLLPALDALRSWADSLLPDDPHSASS